MTHHDYRYRERRPKRYKLLYGSLFIPENLRHFRKNGLTYPYKDPFDEMNVDFWFSQVYGRRKPLKYWR